MVGAWQISGEREYHLSNLPVGASLTKLAGAIKARWVCEQAQPQMTEELGLDHFEGRFSRGLHRDALTTMIAYAFLQHRRLEQAPGEKKACDGGRRNRPCLRSTEPSSRHSPRHYYPQYAPLPKDHPETTNLILPK